MQTPNFVAGGTIAPCRFVSMTATGATAADFTVFQSTAGAVAEGDVVIGVSQEGTDSFSSANAAVAGEQLQIHGPGEIALVECGGNVTAGAALKSDANGKAVATTTDKDRRAGIALQAGASGTKIQVLVIPGYLSV